MISIHPSANIQSKLNYVENIYEIPIDKKRMRRSESVFINLHCPSIIHTIDFYLALQQSFAVLGEIYFPLGYKRHKFLDLCLCIDSTRMV